MSLLDQPDREVVLSDQISEPVRRVAERSWALRVSLGLLQALTLALAVTLGGILALGMLPGMPIVLRVALAAGAWCIGVWGLIHWAIPAFKRLPFFRAAQAIDEAHPETHERISSAIELAAEDDARFKGSPELVNHLMRQAEQDAAAIDPAQVISGKSVLRWVILTLMVISMYGVAMLSVPRTFQEGLRGMTMPWRPGQTRPPVQLKVEPGADMTVGQGEALDITVSVTDPSRPDMSVDRALITLSYTNGPAQAIEMERADTSIFRTRLSAIQQNLSYRISAAGEESPVYKVNVVPRPGVASMSAVYTYPAYTRLAPKEDPSPANGTLDALAGTRARVTIRTTQPVEADQCFLVIAQGQNTIPLKPIDATTLVGEVPINVSGTYHVLLVSKVDGRELKSDITRTRQIVARPDEAPRVKILAPGPTARIRPDDTAPIRFSAEDDFGMSAAELVIQVDNRAAQTLPIDLAGATGQLAEREVELSVRDAMQKAGARDAKRITYFVRASDNAQPKANVGISTKQILEIDRNADRLSLRENMAAAQATAEALRTAEQKLTSAAKKLADLQKVSDERQLSGGERQRLTEARQEMTEATQAIEKAIDTAPETYQKQKDELRQINDKHARPGTEAAARSELAEDGKRRQKNVQDAAEHAAQARDEISTLRQRVEKSVEDDRLKKALADAAQRQQQLARDMENGNKPGEAKNRQEALKKDLEQMVRENENLRKAAQEKNAPKVKSLADKVDEVARRQEQAGDKINDAAESAQISEKVKKIIVEQEKLNRDIARLERQAGPSARAAMAPIPDETKTGNIIKSLQNSQLQGAQAQQRVVAGELDRVASRGGPLDDPANGTDLETIKQDIETLSQDIQTAKKEGRGFDRPSDPVNQKAHDIASKLSKASARPAYTADQRRLQDEARKIAQEAAYSARTGRAEEAQQKLTQAADTLQRITPKIGPQTTKEARALAERQRDLADQVSKLNEASRQAEQRKDDLQQSQEEQQQLAKDIQSVEQDARELAKETQATSPETAEQARRAAESLKRAAADQRKAAEAANSPDLQQAAKASQRAQREIQQAKEVLQPGSTQQANEKQNQQQQNANAQEQKGQQEQQAQDQQQQQGQQGQQAQGQQSQQSQQGQQAQGQQGQQSQQGQQVQGQQGQQSQQGQGAQQAGGQASGQGVGRGQQQGGQSEQQQQQLAQAVQEAHEAQQQAVNEGSAAAAQRAAQALARAQQIAQQMNGQPEGAQPQNGEPGGSQQLGQAKGTPEKPSSVNAGAPNQPTPVPKSGQVAAGDKPSEVNSGPGKTWGDVRPAAVKEIGIAPSDWARLPPLLQKDLLNAAQQKGPPEYQMMIKNYYTQIARMQTDGENR